MAPTRGKHAIETRSVDPRLGHQSRQPGDEVVRLEDDMRGAVAVNAVEALMFRKLLCKIHEKLFAFDEVPVMKSVQDYLATYKLQIT